MHRSLVVNLLVMALGVIVAATVIGLVTLWPDETKLQAAPGSLPTQAETEKARVVGVREAACAEGSNEICRRVTVELLSGKDRGTRTSFTVGDLGEGSNAEVGDRVRVHANPVPSTPTSSPTSSAGDRSRSSS
jgi:hypothetical protein